MDDDSNDGCVRSDSRSLLSNHLPTSSERFGTFFLEIRMMPVAVRWRLKSHAEPAGGLPPGDV